MKSFLPPGPLATLVQALDGTGAMTARVAARLCNAQAVQDYARAGDTLANDIAQQAGLKRYGRFRSRFAHSRFVDCRKSNLLFAVAVLECGFRLADCPASARPDDPCYKGAADVLEAVLQALRESYQAAANIQPTAPLPEPCSGAWWRLAQQVVRRHAQAAAAELGLSESVPPTPLSFEQRLAVNLNRLLDCAQQRLGVTAKSFQTGEEISANACYGRLPPRRAMVLKMTHTGALRVTWSGQDRYLQVFPGAKHQNFAQRLFRILEAEIALEVAGTFARCWDTPLGNAPTAAGDAGNGSTFLDTSSASPAAPPVAAE